MFHVFTERLFLRIKVNIKAGLAAFFPPESLEGETAWGAAILDPVPQVYPRPCDRLSLGLYRHGNMAEPRASVNKWPSKGERERERERERKREREKEREGQQPHP